MTFRMRWPTQYGHITQGFGARPEFYRKFGLPGHEGLDFQAPQGSEIYAVADGFVSDVRLDENSSPQHKPYGTQVRIQHADGYLTIYAHLETVVVTRGQQVKAGQLIALADNTGNSFGSHLHLTLEKKGATARGETNYPYDIIDPTPYLEPFKEQPPVPPTPPDKPTIQVQVHSPEVGYLNMRHAPYVGSELVEQLKDGAILGALEDEATSRSKVGQSGQWLWVRSPSGKTGYVAAWYLKMPANEQPPEPGRVVFVVVDSPDVPLKLRQGPGINYPIITQMPDGTALKSLESEEEVQRKIGRQGQWLHVQTPDGQRGYTAAWYLKQPAAPQPIVPKPIEGKPTRYVQVDSPEFGLKVRRGPSITHPNIWWIPHKTVLESLEDEHTTGGKIGRQGQWLHVRTPSLWEGYVAAWYLKYPDGADKRQAVGEVDLPQGVSPYIFGIHAVTLGDDPQTKGPIRQLYQGSGKKGWILFTEICGHNAAALQPNDDLRARLQDWAEQGYGVIVRLNNGYEPGGTLPESRYYDDFAAAAARWVELYFKRDDLSQSEYTWTIQIGNEQNNPREHPGGWEHPTEHITPEKYADAFNRTYQKIKEVLPNAIVCPGAIDPYNYMPLKLLGNTHWRPLDYYMMMLSHIEALDGIVLHAYTHGPSLSAITHLARFGNGAGPLGDHYFDFQIYREFIERIPGKWKDVPVHITETNHVCRPPSAPTCNDPQAFGWVDADTGWVRALYKEINRWNQAPYAQQIRCGLLYRWSGDAWSLNDKPGVLQDFKEALANDYRWRQTVLTSGPFAFAVTEQAAEEAPQERVLVQPDDLSRIWGVEPSAVATLNALGIHVFEDLAAMNGDQLAEMLAETNLHARLVKTWPLQARAILLGQKIGSWFGKS